MVSIGVWICCVVVDSDISDIGVLYDVIEVICDTGMLCDMIERMYRYDRFGGGGYLI